MKVIDQPIVSAIIFSSDGKVLMGQKPPHKAAVYPDCWHIPGGGVDPGEDLLVALQREIMEETSIDISTLKVELADDLGKGEGIRTMPDDTQVLAKMQFNVYRVDIDKLASEIETREEDDLMNLTWFAPDKLSSVKLTPPSITLFQRLGYLK